MRWRGRRQSGNIEDRRRRGPVVAAGGGIGIIGIILLLILTGGDLGKVLNLVLQQQPPMAPGGGAVVAPDDPQHDEWAEMVAVVLADTEDVWHQLLPRLPAGLAREYVEPKLELFTGSTQSGCGFAAAQMGPFYCPADHKVYIDLGFFDDMRQQLNAPGDFAQAYVVYHEVGHHVQNLLGLTDEVNRRQRELSEEEGNRYSVRLELQSDFLAGVCGHHAQRNWDILEAGDVEEAINAALAIGDDRLQKQSQGYVVPEKFTHGTSVQRRRWFLEGLNSGDPSRMMLLFELPYEQL